MKKRRVLPLSRQRRTAFSGILRISAPVIVTVSPSISYFAPMAERQSSVAFISSEEEIPFITLFPSESPPQIRRRCAMLLEGGASIVPFPFPGLISAIKNFRPFQGEYQSLQDSRRCLFRLRKQRSQDGYNLSDGNPRVSKRRRYEPRQWECQLL